MAYVEYQVRDRIGFITLTRPEKRNALDDGLVAALTEQLTKAEADESVKVIVLAAAGEAFCAGADLAYLQRLQQFSFEENLADSGRLKELFLKIYTLKKVVIAQVQGHALAGGCGLASVCDFIFAVPEAKFGYTEVKIGFVPALVMVFLIRKIGDQKARQLLLSGELLSAAELERMGLVTKTVARESLETEVREFASRLIKNNSGESMRLTKELLSTVQSLSLDEALAYAAEVNSRTRASADCKKGISSFLKKEDITW